MENHSSKGALSRNEAAHYLSISTRYLDQLASRKEIPKCKIGAKTVFRVGDLEMFLSKCMEDK